MKKWAEFVITSVQYNKDKTHIDKVKRFEDEGGELGESAVKTRKAVMAAIKAGRTYVTAFKKDGKWSKGAEVVITEIDGDEYIKTTPDDSKKDNLENLPEFSG